MTTLKEFVTECLVQITEAVIDFDSQSAPKGASANPALLESVEGIAVGDDSHTDTRRKPTVLLIDFDIAISAADKLIGDAEAKGGIKVLSVAMSADGRIEKTKETATASRITFRLPLRLPDTIRTEEDDEARQREDENRRARARNAQTHANRGRNSWMGT